MKSLKVMSSPAEESEKRQLKLTLVAGTLLWFAHLNLVYGVASLSCKWGWFAGKVAGLSTMVLLETIITVVAVLLMAYFVYLPWQKWRNYQEQRPPDNPRMLEDTEEKGSHPLAAFIVMALNSFFLLFILVSLVPIFALLPCGPL